MQACPRVVGQLLAQRTTASLLSCPPPTKNIEVAQYTPQTAVPVAHS